MVTKIAVSSSHDRKVRITCGVQMDFAVTMMALGIAGLSMEDIAVIWKRVSKGLFVSGPLFFL